MNLLGNALLEAVPPIQSLYVYNSNPAVVAPQLNKVKKGLLREDLFTIVHDLFITETAAYADIVLPATSSFEAADLYTSYWHHYAQVQQPVIKPYGESKSNSEVFRLLTEYMGFDHHALRDSDKEMIDQALDYPDNPAISSFSLVKLLKHQYMRADRKPLFPGKLPTPSGKIELFSETMLKDGYPPLPMYIPLPFEDESLYQFVPGPNQHFLNSTFSNNEKHISLEKQPRVFINSGDALKEGIANGDYVRIWNNQGECVLKAAVGAEVLQGVLVSQGLWTNQPGTRQLVNELTPDRVADMGGGATFFSGRVNIEKIVI
jgi:anaerobic selenocysteine-containing dehydrogenase